MKLTIEYRAEYRYERRVSLSPHVVRLFPRDALQARVVSLDFATNETGVVHWRHDLFDNIVAQCFYPREEDRLLYTLRAEIAVEERNAFGFLLDSRALAWPVVSTPREREVAAHLMQGLTSKQTGKLLNISHRTVEIYRARLMRKYQAATAADLVHKLMAG